jgi:hypothetical protein
MRQAKWDTLADDVRAVRERFAAWRQARSNRSRIPAALWAVAAELARRHGVHRVARALGLNDRALRKHALEAARRVPQSAGQPEPPEPALANSSPSATHASEASAQVAARARAQLNAPSPAAPGNIPSHPAQPATADHAPSALSKPAAPPLTNSTPPPSAAPAFIQLPWPALAPTAAVATATARCVVELHHPGGARMTITLHDSGGAGHAHPAQPCASGGLDLAALVQAFWSRPA